MKLFLRSKLAALVLVIALVSLITGVALAANSSLTSSQALTSSVVEIQPIPPEVLAGGRLRVFGAGFAPGELVLFEVFVNSDSAPIVIQGGTANDSGAFEATTPSLPETLLPGLYTIKARTLTSPHVASAPLIVCEPSEGKCPLAGEGPAGQ